MTMEICVSAAELEDEIGEDGGESVLGEPGGGVDMQLHGQKEGYFMPNKL